MSIDRILTVASVIIASIAAGAATFQSYVAYSVRNQPIKAQMAAQFSSTCAENITSAFEYTNQTADFIRALQSGTKPPIKNVELWLAATTKLAQRAHLQTVFASILDRGQATKTYNTIDPSMKKIIAFMQTQADGVSLPYDGLEEFKKEVNLLPNKFAILCSDTLDKTIASHTAPSG